MSIENHEFADVLAEFEVNEATDENKIVLDTGYGGWYFFDKEDVEAMARHFGLIY